jgi:hypothetical protein
MGHLSMGVGPSRDRTSDDTAQNAESSCSGSDETAPPGEKKSLAQGRAPLTTKSASRSPHSVQRNRRAQSGTGIPEPCASRAPASGRRSVGKRYTGETDMIRTLFKSLFLKRWPYFCVNHTVSRLQCQNTPRVGRVRRATATERRGRSVFIIAALSALCWAVLIGLAVLVVSNL